MRNLLTVPVLSCALFLSACGFQPLHGTRANGSSVSADLARVEVAQQHGRLGQLVRNEIVAHISPAGTRSTSAYKLTFETESKVKSLVEARNTETLRHQLQLFVNFELIELSTGNQVYKGKTFSFVSFDHVEAPSTNYFALANARKRAARQTGEDIRTRLAAFFAGR